MTRSLRPGKIFLDWSQNVAAKTTISPYSLRGRELPCAAAPRTWDEVEAGAAEREGISQVMLEDMLDRIAPGGIDEGGQLLADLP
jgi:bifunctional non-homologous end joining protein LigD